LFGTAYNLSQQLLPHPRDGRNRLRSRGCFASQSHSSDIAFCIEFRGVGPLRLALWLAMWAAIIYYGPFFVVFVLLLGVTCLVILYPQQIMVAIAIGVLLWRLGGSYIQGILSSPIVPYLTDILNEWF
jgi:hypothetical protein